MERARPVEGERKIGTWARSGVSRLRQSHTNEPPCSLSRDLDVDRGVVALGRAGERGTAEKSGSLVFRSREKRRALESSRARIGDSRLRSDITRR